MAMRKQNFLIVSTVQAQILLLSISIGAECEHFSADVLGMEPICLCLPEAIRRVNQAHAS